MPLDLAILADAPTVVAVAGRDFKFSELTLAACARLQQWIKQNVRDPWDVAKECLDGLASADRAIVLDQARKDKAAWPPAIGTQAAANALGSTRAGLVEVLYEGLIAHDPDATRADAERLMRRLRKDEAASRRIFGLIFAADDDGDGEIGAGPPKG